MGALVEKVKKQIPKVAAILDEAWEVLSLSSDFIAAKFGGAIRRVDEKAITIYFG